MKLVLLLIVVTFVAVNLPMNPFLAAALWILLVLGFIWLGAANEHAVDTHVRRGVDWSDR